MMEGLWVQRAGHLGGQQLGCTEGLKATAGIQPALYSRTRACCCSGLCVGSVEPLEFLCWWGDGEGKELSLSLFFSLAPSFSFSFFLSFPHNHPSYPSFAHLLPSRCLMGSNVCASQHQSLVLRQGSSVTQLSFFPEYSEYLPWARQWTRTGIMMWKS